MKEFAKLYGRVEWKRYPDVESTLTKAKNIGFKTALVTTIARFKYMKALRPVLDKIDLLVDGYTFHCEKSNSKIYLKTLETLAVKADETEYQFSVL